MPTAGDTQPAEAEEAHLRRTLEGFLRDAQGRPLRVARLRREPSPFATLFPAELLSVTLRDGGEVSVFVKHLGPEQAGHPEKQCRDREVRIYEELLGEAGLPVPRYYGSCWNDATERREVFLEYIGDWSLKYQGVEHWFTAARRLAQLHAYYAGRADKLLRCDYLLRFDAACLHEWAERALAVVGGQSAELAAGLAPVLASYGRVCEVLGRQPLTLVHNDLAPKNVLADRSSNPARICFVDWEMAGVGCGLLDLVDLKYGLGPAEDRQMCAAYCTELAGTGLLPSDPGEMGRLFAACELHRTVYRLAFSTTWGVPPETVAQWVSEARAFARQV